jgi:hypothetical protein
MHASIRTTQLDLDPHGRFRPRPDEVDFRFHHYLCDRALPEFIVQPDHLPRGKRKGVEEIRLGHQATLSRALHDRKDVEVVRGKECFESRRNVCRVAVVTG